MNVTIICKGKSPLLMHSSALANPLHPIVREMKELTSKRKKTEEDFRQIGDLEWKGGIYYEEGVGPYLPSANLLASIKKAAGLSKLGAAVTRSLQLLEPQLPLGYDGPRDLDVLAKDERFRDERIVKLSGAASTLRTRPRFDRWAVSAEAVLDDTGLDPEDLENVVELAGRAFGVGDGRTLQFGRFEGRVLR